MKKVLEVIKNALLLQSQTMRDGGHPEGIGRGRKKFFERLTSSKR